LISQTVNSLLVIIQDVQTNPGTVYIVQRLPVGKWLSLTLVGWGIATASTAAAKNYAGLVTCRVFSGIFEAGVIPCLMLISGQWYTRQEQITRFVWWYMGTASGFLVGGFISWCFQHVSPTASPLNGWQIMLVGRYLLLI
jgi:MFS family permease